MPRRGDNLSHWLTNKERDEQLFKLGQEMDEVMDRLRTVETALVELQSQQLVAKEGPSTTSQIVTPIQTERVEHRESMRDFVQRLITERDTQGPMVAHRTDDITKKVKIDVADFSGDVSPKVFVDWLNSLEDYFAWYNMNDEQRIAFTKVKLKGPARIWWYGVENNELALGQPITRWFNMKERLKSNFLPSDYIDTLHQEYLTLQQGNLSVEEYTNKFREYIVRCNLKTDDRLTITRFSGWIAK